MPRVSNDKGLAAILDDTNKKKLVRNLSLISSTIAAMTSRENQEYLY